MKLQHIIPLLLLIISCRQGTQEKKEPEVKMQGAIEVVETVTDTSSQNGHSGFDEAIGAAKSKTLPVVEMTNFDSFIDEDDYDEIDANALKLDQIYPDFNNENYSFRPIAYYQVPLSNNFHTIVITLLKGEHEMTTVLINYDTEGKPIAHEEVGFDEIAESMSRTVSRISENKLTVNRIFWGNIREVEEIEYEIRGDGTIKKVGTKKLNDSFENFTLINSVLMDLKLDWIQTKTNLIRTLEDPNNLYETIVVIPEIVDEGDHYFELNSHILVVDNRSGKITHKYFESKKTNEWISDAIELNGIQIDSNSYQISEDKIAFGVSVSYFGHSQVNPYSNKKLSLFVKSGDSLVKILSNYTIENYHGEWDGDCDGGFNETKKSLRMSQEKTNGYFDISVTKEMIFSEQFKDKNGECLITEKISTENTILKFNGWRYAEYGLDAKLYYEFHPQKVENIAVDKVHVNHAHQLEDFKFVEGYYKPVDGKIVPPDTEKNQGHRLFMLNADNEIIYKSIGFGEAYLFEPHFYKSTASNKIIIICQKWFEYPFGGEVFILENENVKHIGSLEVEGYNPEQDDDKIMTEIVEITEGKNDLVFSFKTDKLVLNPGLENENIVPNHNVRYVYKNNKLSLLWNNE